MTRRLGYQGYASEALISRSVGASGAAFVILPSPRYQLPLATLCLSKQHLDQSGLMGI